MLDKVGAVGLATTARRGDCAVDASHPPHKASAESVQALLAARLIGANAATVAGITARGPAPVLALCRDLIAAGFLPDLPLRCYRGATLCLTVRTIGEAANLAINSKGTGFIKPACAVRTASPMRQTARRLVP